MTDLIERTLCAAKCVYLATEESVADDLSGILKQKPPPNSPA
jgi:hypothetical protein